MKNRTVRRARRLIQSLSVGLAAMGAGAAMASEHIVEIAWRGDSGFEHSASIAPGKFLELCGKLSKGSTVKWQFEAAAPLAFNIHYHQGKEVVFPAKLAKADRAQDVLNVPVDQDYCWMWSNKGNEAAKVKVQLQR